MILDAIITLFFGIFQATFAAGAAVINLIAAAIEAIVGIFVEGFSLGRIGRGSDRKASPGEVALATLPTLIVVIAIAAFLFGPKLLEREITLTAPDGHPLPLAALVIESSGKTEYRRTDTVGNIRIPRFGLRSITLKDPRYVETTWPAAQVTSPLVVRRTVLGSSLDKLADKLLRPSDQ